MLLSLLAGLTWANPISMDPTSTSFDSQHWIWLNDSQLAVPNAWRWSSALEHSSPRSSHHLRSQPHSDLSLTRFDTTISSVRGRFSLGATLPVLHLEETGISPNKALHWGNLTWSLKHQLRAPENQMGVAVLIQHDLPTSSLDPAVYASHNLRTELVLSSQQADSSVPDRKWHWGLNMGYQKSLENTSAKLYARAGVGRVFSQDSGASIEMRTSTPLGKNASSSSESELSLGGFQDVYGLRVKLGLGIGIGGSVEDTALRGSLGISYQPKYNKKDRDGDGLVDEVDACPLEPEDEDGVDDFDGCIDHPRVTVRFVDQKGHLVAKRPFRLAGRQGLSEETQEIPAGTWSLRSPKQPFRILNPTVTIPDAENHVLEVQVEYPYQSTSVRIQDQQGAALSDLRWGLVDGPRHTGSQGALPVGEQFVRFSANGHRSIIQKVFIDPKKPTTLSVTLKKSQAQRQGRNIVLEAPILFAKPKSNRLAIRSYSVLNDVVDLIQSHPDLVFVIETHTDSIGSAKANQTHTEQQAHAIKHYLVQNDISPKRLRIQAHGESKPIASNMLEKGRSQNRRVHFRIQDPPSLSQNLSATRQR